MTSPAPSSGEEPLDEQSETVSAPSGDDAPPQRTRRTGPLVALPLLAWLAVGVAIIVVVVMLLL
jgi:hypothetical protein